jgi:ABC-type cobalt transport system substrate-binding protein
MPRKISLSGLQIILILAASIVSLTLTEAGSFGTARGQGSLELTPEQKAAICDPNNP